MTPPSETSKEGYFKFTPKYVGSLELSVENVTQLNGWRDRLYRARLIGQYTEGEYAGIGYGNISLRTPAGFLITATRTGGIAQLDAQHYVEVVEVNLDANAVAYRATDATAIPSSESITHGMFYHADPTIQAVIHVHHLAFWQRLLDDYPTTSRTVAYGTPEMGQEILRLFRVNNLKECGLVAMGGHEEGIVAFGRNLNEAGSLLLSAYTRNGFA